ncbi:MAG: chromate transporter [Fusobacteriaceae bacterium]
MLLQLFIIFFKIGIFTFGGGYAMIPLIEKEILENKNWISKDELMEIISISQMTPGPIATNAATFVGRKMGGFSGAVAATVGVVFPSLIIITIISTFFSKNFNNIYVQKIFTGMRAGITASIFLSVKKLATTGIKGKSGLLIFLISITSLIFSFVSPFSLIGIFGLGSIALYLLSERKNRIVSERGVKQ